MTNNKKQELIQQLDQLKAENEKYKKKFQEFFNIDNQECWDVAFLQDEKAKAEQKLKQTKEIIKQINNECFYNDFDCKYCDMKNGCAYFNKSKILQIIDEVE